MSRIKQEAVLFENRREKTKANTNNKSCAVQTLIGVRTRSLSQGSLIHEGEGVLLERTHSAPSIISVVETDKKATARKRKENDTQGRGEQPMTKKKRSATPKRAQEDIVSPRRTRSRR